jgi:hypothetical protein
MIPEEGLHYLKLISETLTDINTELNTSLLPKELTLANTFSVAAKLLSLLAMCSQSTILLRVLLSATSNPPLEIKDLTQDALEPTPQSWDTLMMDPEPELDFPQVPERLYLEAAERPLVLLLVEVEMKSQS